MDKIVEIQNLNMHYGKLHVLRDVSLDVSYGDVIVLCGPSGAGKSTLLRCINQLEKPSGGYVKVFGEEVTKGSRKKLLEMRKHCGMVFQHFNLFPHLTAMENVVIGQVKVLKRTKVEAEKKAQDVLNLVGLADKFDAYPKHLSGGQQQRVAIARGLAMDPKMMLFDEPTSALDPEMIKEVLDVMVKLAKSGMTMVIVTHEMGFAREVATKICFLESGKIVEITEKDQFFVSPQSDRAKSFLNKIL